MEQFKHEYLQDLPIEDLSMITLKRALIQIDRYINLELNHKIVVQYCAVKVDIINAMMHLDDNEHFKIY